MNSLCNRAIIGNGHEESRCLNAPPVHITIPEFSLVVLIGASGSGKTTFARKHFQSTEIVSSDHCRALISDDENDQTATPEAFRLLRLIAEFRLRKGRLTVVDATSVQSRSRLPLLDLARRYGAPPLAIAFDLDEAACLARNSRRLERVVPAPVIANQRHDLRHSLTQLETEGFTAVYVLNSTEEVENAVITRRRGSMKPSTTPGPKKGRFRILLTRIRRFL